MPKSLISRQRTCDRLHIGNISALPTSLALSPLPCHCPSGSLPPSTSPSPCRAAPHHLPPSAAPSPAQVTHAFPLSPNVIVIALATLQWSLGTSQTLATAVDGLAPVPLPTALLPCTASLSPPPPGTTRDHPGPPDHRVRPTQNRLTPTLRPLAGYGLWDQQLQVLAGFPLDPLDPRLTPWPRWTTPDRQVMDSAAFPTISDPFSASFPLPVR